MANKIKLLPEQVANQIAAGEVVDRPASVVKELVENSLDAGAAAVSIEVEQGGRRLVRVVDDGEGMSPDDSLLCLERHATSKVRKSADLFSIKTLGFRGEAIPSVAAVSSFTLVTREADADSGTRIEIEGGVIKSVSEAGAPPGTEIEVRRLFFNVPARRKFLKSVETEFGHVSTFVANMALARPDVHFRLTHNGRVIYDLPRSTDLGGRLRHALGSDAMSQLVSVDRSFDNVVREGEIRIHGFVSVPSYTRSSTRSLHVFVNRRFVRDRLANHAVFEAYRNLTPKGRYPLVVLFIDLPVESVDVNVHPAKHEIRFREQAGVHQALVDAIRDALRLADRAGVDPLSRPASHDAPMRPDEGAGEGKSPSPGRMPPGAPAHDTIQGDPDVRRGVAEAMRRYQDRVAERDLFSEGRPRSGSRPAAGSGRPAQAPPPLPRPGAPADLSGIRFSELRVIGQLGASYILAESPDSLVVIDQHAAHERIMFERLRSEYASQSVLRQPLLFPDTVELTLEEAQRVVDHQETLLRLGFEVEPFGGGTVMVKALPSMLSGVDPARLLVEVADRLEDLRSGSVLSEELDEIFAVMACHSVVRAHEPLNPGQMRSLLESMDRIEFPGHCPHGRDVVARIPLRDLEKWFGR